jgi:hypothetical protein
MAIVAGDILWKYSVAAAAGNTTAGTAAGSLGDQISTTQVPAATLHALFDAISGAENAALDVEYRCIFVHNAHGSLALQNAVVWLQAETALGSDIAIAIDNAAASAIGSGSAQADVVANEGTAPSAVGAFSSPTTKGAGLSLGTLNAGQCRAIWVRRTALGGAAVTPDGVTLRVEGDTAA